MKRRFMGESNIKEIEEEEAPTKPPMDTAVPMTDADRQRFVAAAIDAANDARIKAAQEAKLKDPHRKLQWNPNIGPTSPVWDAVRQRFRHYLTARSVLSVLEAQFDEVQRLYIYPLATDGEILFIQNRDGALYDASFKPGGKFHGVQNNLATKLTMLKFGLPIASLTLNNILNAAKDEDVDDEEDEPEDMPPEQRILYMEKPLEFLNKYHQRSQGHPIIRTELSRHYPQPPALAPSTTATDVPPGPTTPRSPLRNHHGHPQQPLTAPSMPSVRVPMMENSQGHSHHNIPFTGRVPLNAPINPGVPKVGLRGGAGSPSKVKKKEPLKHPEVGEPGVGIAATSRWLFGPNHMKFEVSDSWHSFLDAALQLLGVNNDGDFEFNVDIYDDNLAAGTRMQNMKPYQRTIDITEENIESEYAINISRALFSSTSDWIAVIRPPQDEVGGDRPPRYFNPYLPPLVEYPDSEAEIRTIYGSSGNIVLRNSHMEARSEFKALALRLIGRYHETEAWTFSIDIRRSAEDNVASETITFMKSGATSNYNLLFDKHVKPIFQKAPPWNMFVRPTSLAIPQTVTELEPERNRIDVIRFIQDHVGTSYWRIPKMLRDDYGINQFQLGFHHALQFLNPVHPFGKVIIDNQPLGRGSFEMSTDFWRHLRKRLSAGIRNFSIVITSGTKIGPAHSGYARYVGGEAEIEFRSTDYDGMYEDIKSNLKQTVRPAKSPAHFRVWRNPEEREAGLEGELMKMKPKHAAVATLKQLFTDPGYVEIAQFRAEWGEFQIHDSNDPTSVVTWNLQHAGTCTLASFRTELKRLFKNPNLDPEASFSITENMATGSDRRFVITEGTTEVEWRSDVFDWLSSCSLFVQMDVKIPYQIDRHNQWGVFYRNQPEVKRPSVLPKTLEDLKAIADLEKQMDSLDAEQAKAEKASRMQLPSTAPTAASSSINTAPRFNKARNEAERAGRHPAQQWTAWSKESRTLDALHTSSYTKDQGVIVPGRAPAAPMYSESLELQLKVSDALPTIYSQRLTPTDFRQLQEYNQVLRNAVLERMWTCPICNYNIKAYEEGEKIKHIQEHQDREKVDGVCVWCGDTQWGFMSTEQKAKHQRHHIATEDTMKMNNFWEAHDCPACNTSFKHMKPEDIVAHCINRHAPGTVQFCDRCGIHETHLNRAHHDHHERSCKEQLPNTPRSDFCSRCGKDVSQQTPEQATLHTRDCHVSGGHFCQTCGLDVAHFTAEAHKAHALVCKRPSGPKKTYCRKCGKHLAGKGTVEWYSHNEKCWKKQDPQVQNPMSFADEFEKLVEQKEKIALLNAQWTARKDYVERREGGLEQRDKNLRKAEMAINAQKHKLNSDHQEQRRVLNEGMVALTAQQQGLAPPVSDLGTCQFDGCTAEIGTMSRQELFNHFSRHSQEARDAKIAGIQFNCQIINPDGTVCGMVLDLAHAADFGRHLIHRLDTPARQAAAKQAFQYTAGTNARLRIATRDLRAANEVGRAYGGATTRIGEPVPPMPTSPVPARTPHPPPFPKSLTAASRAESQRCQAQWASETAEKDKLRKLQASTRPEPMSGDSRAEQNRTQDRWTHEMRLQADLKKEQDGVAISNRPPPPPPPSSPSKSQSESPSLRALRAAVEAERASKEKAYRENVQRMQEARDQRSQDKGTGKSTQDVKDEVEGDAASRKPQACTGAGQAKMTAGGSVTSDKSAAPIDPTDKGGSSSSRRAKRHKHQHGDTLFRPVADSTDEVEEDSGTAEEVFLLKKKGRPANLTITSTKTMKRKQVDVEKGNAMTSATAAGRPTKAPSPAKKQKTSAGPVEPARRSTRSNSTPAPGLKKFESSSMRTTGRARLQPPVDNEYENPEEEAPVSKASPAKKSRKSPIKK